MSSTKLDRTARLDASQKTEPLGARVEKTEPLPPVERTLHMAPADIDRAIAAEHDMAPPSAGLPMWVALVACLAVGLLLGGGAVLLLQFGSENGPAVPPGVHAAAGTVTAERPEVVQAANPQAPSDTPPLVEPADLPAVEAAAPADDNAHRTDTAEPTTARRATQRASTRGERGGEGGPGTRQDGLGGMGAAQGGEGGPGTRQDGLGGMGAAQGGEGGVGARGGDLGGPPAEQEREGEQVVERDIRGRINVQGLEDESGAGVFDSNLVVRQLRLRQPAIQRCYERELRDDPRLAGRVVARFSIHPNGTVTGATATENSTGSPAVATCVLNAVRGCASTPVPTAER